jgi:hypothetical protein
VTWLWFVLFTTAAHAGPSSAGAISGTVRYGTQTVASAIVYLGVGNPRPSPTNPPPAILTQVNGEWVPHIQLARSGAALVLKNSDPTLHIAQVEVLNATNTPRRISTEAMPYAGYEKKIPLETSRTPFVVRVTTGNSEEGAAAYVAVLPHPWGAVSDAQGRFVIEGVPAGAFKLLAWHETLGGRAREVRVTSGRTTDVSMDYPAPASR